MLLQNTHSSGETLRSRKNSNAIMVSGMRVVVTKVNNLTMSSVPTFRGLGSISTPHAHQLSAVRWRSWLSHLSNIHLGGSDTEGPQFKPGSNHFSSFLCCVNELLSHRVNRTGRGRMRSFFFPFEEIISSSGTPARGKQRNTTGLASRKTQVQRSTAIKSPVIQPPSSLPS